ncbi:MAG: UDP-3-O-(3-hydroxymyristoyl)glucosamine N-acyltransferase [Gemmatimonadetes bacterium]|nr:UDP-3-O-(3-hydroxymyristoyl)glucosamine N-acyltransferase [Gemmatimonadota bacterium]
MPTYTLDEVAEAIGATLVGDGALTVSGLAPLPEAAPGQLSFFASRRYLPQALASRATALIVPAEFPANGGPALLRVADPYAAYVLAARFFESLTKAPAGVHPTVVLGEGSRLGARVSVAAGAILGPRVELDDDVRIGEGCVVAEGVRIGAGTRVGPRVTLLAGTRIGSRCVLQSGTVIGSDGFGYVPAGEGHARIPQLGGVRIEDDVEIGANCTIDRGSLGDTRIGRGSKLDNLVHVAHNVDVGEHVLIVAQVGISGSTRIGDGAALGGQVGVVGHIEVGAGARIGAQSGVTKSVPAGEEWFGYPARERRRSFRLQALCARLPDLERRLKRVEERLASREGTR